MRTFTTPKMEIVHFSGTDVIMTSACNCPECPEGKDDCECYDSWSSDYPKAGSSSFSGPSAPSIMTSF